VSIFAASALVCGEGASISFAPEALVWQVGKAGLGPGLFGLGLSRKYLAVGRLIRSSGSVMRRLAVAPVNSDGFS